MTSYYDKSSNVGVGVAVSWNNDQPAGKVTQINLVTGDVANEFTLNMGIFCVSAFFHAVDDGEQLNLICGGVDGNVTVFFDALNENCNKEVLRGEGKSGDVQDYLSHEDMVSAVAVVKNPNKFKVWTVVSGSHDNCVKLWEIDLSKKPQSGQQCCRYLQTVVELEDGLLSCSIYYPTSQSPVVAPFVITGSLDGRFSIWKHSVLHPSNVTSVQYVETELVGHTGVVNDVTMLLGMCSLFLNPTLLEILLIFFSPKYLLQKQKIVMKL